MVVAFRTDDMGQPTLDIENVLSQGLTPSFPSFLISCLVLARRLQILAHLLPVDHIPKVLNIFRAAILIKKVVGMLPDIDTKNWLKAFH
jgi:hypothetical protein